MQLVVEGGSSRPKDAFESLYIDNLIAIKKTKACPNLILQIRVAPIRGIGHHYPPVDGALPNNGS